MAKDALGHGSDGGGGSGNRANRMPLAGHPYHSKSDMELRYIQKDAHEAGRNAQEMGDHRGINKYADQVNDAATVLAYRARGDVSAAQALASNSPKSAAPAPTHSAMGGWEGSMMHNAKGR